MKRIFIHTYDSIISLENLLEVWQEFIKGKQNRKDVQEFEQRLMTNVIKLYSELKKGNYTHSKYEAFNISDPKPRNIHKALVRDRLLHHLIYRNLYPFFDKTFISDSYSCRVNKGTHKALDQFRRYGRKVSNNHTRTCWVLKCDIKKFFNNIDHSVLKEILARYIGDDKLLKLLHQIVDSFSFVENKGLPLGNLTSQLLVNIYMNEFDQFVKHRLKIRYYIRYADDFVFLSDCREELEKLIPKINSYLNKKLRLAIHPNKISITTFSSGIDFLGWVHFSDHRVLRNNTKNRILRNIEEKQAEVQTVQSCLGLVSHGNTEKIKTEINYISHNT